MFKQKALRYANMYGIVDYKLKNNIMTYNVSYPDYLGTPRHTVKYTVDLKTDLVTTEVLKRFSTKAIINNNSRKGR